MADQEKLYQESPKEKQTIESIKDLKNEIETNSVFLNFWRPIRIFQIPLEDTSEGDDTTEVNIEKKNQLTKELEAKFQFRSESKEWTNPNGGGIFIPENNDFFYMGFGEANWPWSLFFSTDWNPQKTPLLKRIFDFNKKSLSTSNIWTIDISPKTLWEKINGFLKKMGAYYESKLRNTDWKHLEEVFIPTYKFISETERKQDSLGKERLIILLISQEKELFEKAKILVEILPQELQKEIPFDFNTIIKRYNHTLENLSEKAPLETESQRTQYLSIFLKKQEYDTGIRKMFDALYQNGNSSKEALKKAQQDWFLGFFLHHPNKALAKIWEKKIKSWWTKQDIKMYYDWLQRDDTKIFISALQYQIFWREEKEKIDGKGENLPFKKMIELSRN